MPRLDAAKMEESLPINSEQALQLVIVRLGTWLVYILRNASFPTAVPRFDV